MPDSPAEQLLGPIIKIANRAEKYYPYQELKERLGPQKYDAIIVFGEGPIKRIFFSNEEDKIKDLYKADKIDRFNESKNSKPPEGISGKELVDWLETQGPRTKYDPDYTIADITPHGPSKTEPTKDINPNFERVKEILEATESLPEERKKLFEKFRTELENKARHSYKRYGELNAIASGLMLYSGKTDKLIFSGGRTIPDDKIKQGLGFPSEAELMRDLVIRNFGQKMFERDNPDATSDDPEDMRVYKERYNDYITKTIHKYFVIEDSATNTIDNIIRSINHAPETLFSKDKTPEGGLLGNNHQVERCVTLLNLFTGNEEGAHPISAQNDVLKPFAEIRNKLGEKGFLPELLRYMTDEPTNRDLDDKTKGEAVGREKLQKAEDMFWWLGYVSHSEVPEVFNAIMKKLNEPKWQPYSAKAFKDYFGLDFQDYATLDYRFNEEKMEELKGKFETILINKKDSKSNDLRQQKIMVS